MEGSRRDVLPPGAAAAAAGTGVIDPDDALRMLTEGNRRFLEGRVLAPHRSRARAQAIADRPRPFAAVLACADSRVPVEIVLDQGLGDLFVARLAGSVATPEAIGSVEYAAAVLGTPLVVVLGHTACVAVASALAGEPVPGQIATLFPHILAGIDPAHRDLAAAIPANVRHQARGLAASPVLAGLAREGRLRIIGAVYDVATGAVTVVPI